VETLGRYQILGELGRGGCGIVYRALDPGIGRAVAIKTILADVNSPAGAALRERFRREARSAGNLSHPNIVTIHEFNDSGEIMFIAMELIQGQSLADRIAESGPLPLNLVLAVICSAADALDYAHSSGIVHRDIKPANFMLTAAGQVKVTDFGIAKMLDDDIALTNTGMVVGTVQYMSPEQIEAKPASARSDQFSLGVIAYEMLTGQKPFQGDSWASVMNQIMSVEPPPVKQHRQDLGDEVTSVLRKALAKDPEARYSSCREFADNLATATGVTMRTAPMPIGETLTKPLPPRKDALPETEAMISVTALPARPDSAPDTGQKLAPTLSTASAKTAPAEQAARRRPPPVPVLIGAVAALILVAGWWQFSARPISAPPQPATAVATTAAPVTSAPPSTPPAEATSQPAGQSSTPALPSSKKEIAPRPLASKSTSAAASQPAQPPPVAAVSAPPGAVPATAPGPLVATPAPPVAPPAQQVATPAPSIAPQVQSSPAPAPEVVPSAPAAPAGAHNPEVDANAGRAEEQRKAAELSAARTAVDQALNRYRTAFENKDPEALKSIWPGLGRSELIAFQNFFKIARSIKLQLRPLSEAEISPTGATVRARRTMAATDERGALPPQDQTVNIHLRRSGSGMVIESIDIARQ